MSANVTFAAKSCRTERMAIGVQFNTQLSFGVEVATLRALIRHQPDEPNYPLRLARTLAFGDRHDEALIVAQDARRRFPDHAGFLVIEGECANALGDPERARTILSDLPSIAGPGLLSFALHELGTAEESLGLIDAAEHHYGCALEARCDAPRPCKSLHGLLRTRGDLQGILRSCDQLERQGVHHARMHADRMVASAIAGRKQEALEAFAFDRFACFETIDALIDTHRWSDVGAFNDALAAELAADPNRQYGRRMTASRYSWRVQQPFSGFDRPALHALRDMVAVIAERHAASIVSDDHFFSRRGRPRLGCSSWAIHAPGDGYEDWHVHPGAWLTGVYYVKVPRSPHHAGEEGGDDRGGCITFGLPDYDGMPDPGKDWRTIRPREGMLALFPSHCFHRTWPTHSSEQRWVVAFDIFPLDD